MEEQNTKRMTFFTKISIILNTLLFGITGIIYLIDHNNIIGIILLVAGGMNVLYALATVQTKNLFFVIFNFIFAAVSLLVCIDYLLQKGNFMGMVWMIITLYYLIVGFILLIQVNKKKS